MPVRALRPMPVHIWVPPKAGANWRLTVQRADDSIDDITDLVSNVEIEDGVTESIGNFRFELWNPNETYTGVWIGNEIVRYYSDYDTTATTIRFRGRIEKPSNRGNKLMVTGSGESMLMRDITVTQQYTDEETSIILKDLNTKYGDGRFTVNNVDVSSEVVTKNWVQKPFLEALKEIATDAGFDVYLDASLDWNYFESGTRSNPDEAIVHESNMLEIGDFGPDLTQLRNRIVVYGAEQQGIQIIYTAESDDDTYGVDSSFGVKEEIIENDNIVTYDQAKLLGDAILAERQNPQIVGDVKGVQLATIQPGQKIKLSSPADNLPPDEYKCVKYKHNLPIENGILSTTVTIEKEPRMVSHIIRNLMADQSDTKKVSINPNEMRHSLNFLFDTDVGLHTDTEIVEGELKLQSGESSGVWLSTSQSLPDDITEAYLVMNGEKLDGTTIEVSANNKTSYQTITNRELISLVLARGKTISLRVTIADTTTRISSLSLQYKS